MTCSVVSDARSLMQNGVMEYESVILFTKEPPLGEDHFTVVARKDISNMPLGVKPDLRMTNEFRKKEHLIEYRAPKGRTPLTSMSCIFSRVEKGK